MSAFLIGESINDSLHVGSRYSFMTEVSNDAYKNPSFLGDGRSRQETHASSVLKLASGISRLIFIAKSIVSYPVGATC